MQEIKEIKAQLEVERDKLLGTIHGLIKNDDHEVGDEIDSSVTEQGKTLNLLLKDHEKAKLEKIEEALLRIETGEYGICLECDEMISAARLKALPFAKNCVNCQQEIEKVEKFSFQNAPTTDD